MSFLKTNRVTIEVGGTRYDSLLDFGLAIGNTDYIGDLVRDDSCLAFVPGRPGPLDLSENVFGDTPYQYRQIRIEFGGLNNPAEWDQRISDFRNLFEGKQVKIWFWTDSQWYWTGKAHIVKFEHSRALGTFEFQIPYADPYKHRETENEVASTATATVMILSNTLQKTVPTVINDAAITITKGQTSVELAAGTHLVPELQLDPGDTEWSVTGAANVTIRYTEGSL